TTPPGASGAGVASGAIGQGRTAPVPPSSSGTPALGPIAAESLVATVDPAGAPGSQAPGGPATTQVPGSWLGAASVLPVIAQRPGWVEGRLAQRPNESVDWVPSSRISLARDPYHIVVNLSTMHLLLFDQGREVASFPAGIGVPSDPTPAGHFFVALFAQAPSPGYGAFIM